MYVRASTVKQDKIKDGENCCVHLKVYTTFLNDRYCALPGMLQQNTLQHTVNWCPRKPLVKNKSAADMHLLGEKKESFVTAQKIKMLAHSNENEDVTNQHTISYLSRCSSRTSCLGRETPFPIRERSKGKPE